MANKRPNGEGSFFFDEAKGLYRGMLVTPAGKRITKSSKNEDIVHDWFNEQKLLIGRGQHVEPNTVTLGDWYKEWLEVYVKPRVRQKTYECYSGFSKHLEPIEKISLKDLLPSHVNKIYNNMQHHSGSTKKKFHVVLKNSLQQAKFERLVQENIMERVQVPKAVKPEMQFFTAEETHAILAAAANNKYHAFIDLAFATGMRFSELIGLQWHDIDLQQGIIKIRRTLHQTQTGLVEEEPKTKSSKRDLRISDSTLAILQKHEEKAKTKKRNSPKMNVFVNIAGKPIDHHNFTIRDWRKVQDEAEKSRREKARFISHKIRTEKLSFYQTYGSYAFIS